MHFLIINKLKYAEIDMWYVLKTTKEYNSLNKNKNNEENSKPV